MVNLEKYRNDGWGLSKKCFENIISILKTFSHLINVVEFGSGVSTEFLVDMLGEHYNLNIISYDDDAKYATKAVHSQLKLYITGLVECHDSDFENQFTEKHYNKNLFFKKITPVHTRQKNAFYDIQEGQLPDVIDLMIVDGPHGNGRSIAFLHAIGRLRKGSFVVIDDYNHYDFVERFQRLFPESELVAASNTGSVNQWELGGVYQIFKIK
jgi:hypothetical protein